MNPTPPPASLRPKLPKRSGDLKRTALAVVILLGIVAVGLFLTWGYTPDAAKEPTTPMVPAPVVKRSAAHPFWEYSPQLPTEVPKAEAAPESNSVKHDALADEIRKLVTAQQGTQAQLEIMTKAILALQQRPGQPSTATVAPMVSAPKENADERKRRLEEAEREREEAERKLKDWKPLTREGPTTDEKTGKGVKPLATPYTLPPGWLINCATEAQLSNESRGPFRAFVTTPVRNVAGNAVVIPQGSWLVGEPAGQTLYGDSRISVAFSSLTFPNGDTIELTKAVGSDRSGTSGFTDQIDRHYGRLLAAVVMTGVLRGGTSVIGGGLGYGIGQDPAQAIGGAVASETAQRGTHEMRQFLRTDPTITVRHGYQCNILLQSSLEFAHAYRP